MQPVTLHKEKLFALLEAAFALIGLFLTWTVEKYNNPQMGNQNQMGGFGQMNQMNAMTTQTQNGFHSWGYLALVGVIGVVIAILLTPDKTKPYDKNTKTITLLSFLAIIVGALVYMITLSSEAKKLTAAYQQQYGITYDASAGMGLWVTLVAGVVGLAWVSGFLTKLSVNNTNPPTTPTTPAPPATPTVTQ